MSEPVVNVDLPLSPADVEPETVSASAVENHEPTGTDSAELSDNVPRGTTDTDTDTDTDPVADAVSMAVEQWVGFDPMIHARNPDGSPRLRVDGSYARKRGSGGRKSDATVSRETGDDLFPGTGTGPSVPRGTDTDETSAAPPQTPTTPTVAAVLSSREAAAAIVITSTTILSRMVGAEWAAEKPELKSLTDATKTYIDAKGGIQMSPEMGLFLAVSMYAAPRFAHENTRSKFGQLVDWCRDRFAILKARIGRK